MIVQVSQLTEDVPSAAEAKQVLTPRCVMHNDLDRASMEYQNKATPIALHQEMLACRMQGRRTEVEQCQAIGGL
ncbi:MAG TPA: hypothetical protein VGJ13_09190 [Pseudonocardiaceae bacterium]